MKQLRKKALRRLRRRRHVRKGVSGVPERPRLTVFRSHKHIYAQVVDDTAGRTILAVCSQDGPLRQKLQGGGGNRAAAKLVGAELAARAKQAGIVKVVFDRNGYPYHGRVRELADAAREGGLEF